MATPKLPRKLRVTIVGHASPRWRGAANDADADKRNEKLASQRAESVFAITERLLRERLGQDVVIEKNVTVVPGMEQPDLVLSASGEGSRDALQDKHKSRSSDDEYDRRVEVSIDLLRTLDVKSGRSLPSEQAKTRYWAVTINRLSVLRPLIAAGGIEICIRNRKTGKGSAGDRQALRHGILFRSNPFAHGGNRTGRRRAPVLTTDEEDRHLGVRRRLDLGHARSTSGWASAGKSWCSVSRRSTDHTALDASLVPPPANLPVASISWGHFFTCGATPTTGSTRRTSCTRRATSARTRA